MILGVFQFITGFIAIILFILGIILGYCLIYAVIVHNKGLKILELNDIDETLAKDKLAKLKEFANNDLFSSINNMYPLFNNNYSKEEIENNILFKPKESKNNYKILLTVNVDINKSETYLTNNHIHGSNLYNNKALLFTIIEAIENKLKLNQLDFDLSILLILDKKQIVSTVEEKYDLLLEENGGIIDPITSKLRSYYAFIGTINAGNSIIRFKTDQYGNGKARLNEFIKDIREIISKPQLNKVIKSILKDVAKDMSYSDRFLFQNPTLFSMFVKNSLYESDFKFLQTNITKIKCGEIVKSNNEYYVDIEFNFSINNDVGKVLKDIEKSLNKYSISYQIVKNVFASKETKKDDESFKLLERVIEKTFHEVYVTRFIVDDPQCNLAIDKLGKEHLNFSPIYYSRNARINHEKGIEYVSKGSIILAIEFYNRFIDEYNRRVKCFVETVAEK